MSIYSRDEVFPEWEGIPWPLLGKAADAQERGFHERAVKAIAWTPVPWKAFPSAGIFGHDRDWFGSNDVEFYATFDGEDLILIENTWFGWPDPPRWALYSRREGETGARWSPWGHFPDLPAAWRLPELEG